MVNAELASEVRLAVMRLARRLRNQRADTGLSIAFIAALGTIERNGSISPRDLADLEKISPPSMTKILATLESEGYIERSPHPTDGRQVLITTSELGRQMLSDDRKRRDAWLSQHMAALSPEERDVLRQAAVIIDRINAS